MHNFATVLTPEQVIRVHQASLEILEKVGLLVRNPQARQILARNGCAVDEATLNVRFPRDVVEDFRASIPPTFTFYARDPKLDKTLPGDTPVIVTGSSAPNILDPLNGQERRATSEDLARIAHLVNSLPGHDVFSISTLAEDAPPGLFSVTRFYAALKNTASPCGAAGRRRTSTDHHCSSPLPAGSLLCNFVSILLPGGLTVDDGLRLGGGPDLLHRARPAVLPDDRPQRRADLADHAGRDAGAG
jgi:trimethylamine:corrinoid methyltransferase-like protein